jgi:hypothetical protein
VPRHGGLGKHAPTRRRLLQGAAFGPLLSLILLPCRPTRNPAQSHRFSYNEPMPLESCTQSLCDLALQFGEDDDEGGGGMVRGMGFVCPAAWLQPAGRACIRVKQRPIQGACQHQQDQEH